MRNPAFVTSSLVILALIVSGCGAGGENAESVPESDSQKGAASSEAWNAEIDRVLAEAQSDSVREVLADYTITEVEISRLRDELTACLKPVGVTDIKFSDDEVGYETNTPDVASEKLVQQMNECEMSVGYEKVMLLYLGMLDNPLKEDRTP